MTRATPWADDLVWTADGARVAGVTAVKTTFPLGPRYALPVRKRTAFVISAEVSSGARLSRMARWPLRHG